MLKSLKRHQQSCTLAKQRQKYTNNYTKKINRIIDHRTETIPRLQRGRRRSTYDSTRDWRMYTGPVYLHCDVFTDRSSPLSLQIPTAYKHCVRLGFVTFAQAFSRLLSCSRSRPACVALARLSRTANCRGLHLGQALDVTVQLP